MLCFPSLARHTMWLVIAVVANLPTGGGAFILFLSMSIIIGRCPT